MKKGELPKIIWRCLPVVVVAVLGGKPLTARETSDLPSLVVLEKNVQAESTATCIVSLGGSPKPKRFSWKGAPLPYCKSFLLTEAELAYRFNSPPKFNNRQHSFLSWDLGIMVNRGEHSAIGGTLFLGIDDASTAMRFGIRPRYRRWLSRTSSLDFSTGIFVVKPDAGSERLLGLSGHVGLNLSNWFGFAGRVEFTPYKGMYNHPHTHELLPQKKDVALWGGIRLGTKPGLIFSGALALAGLIIHSGGAAAF